MLEHGLIGLSLRPLAAALGTSDRMLLYHFASKDDLVATVLRVSNDRSVAELRALPPSPDVRAAVLDLWARVTRAGLTRCQRLYVEAAALGLFGREPYAYGGPRGQRRVGRGGRRPSGRAGLPRERARRAVALLDAALHGLPARPAARPRRPGAGRRRSQDLADAVAAIAVGPAAQGSA